MGGYHDAARRLMLTVLGGLAEFERELIRARTAEGRARAKANGKSLGRPFKLTDHQRREARKRLEVGDTVRELARNFNVSPATISRLNALTEITLTRTDPARNMRRFYTLDVQRDLFGGLAPDPRMGPHRRRRPASQHPVAASRYLTEGEAQAVFDKQLRRRERRG